MERALMQSLVAWKDHPRRKPLLLFGARQVGKTWLLREFGRRQFDNVAYVNFDNNATLAARFDQGFDIARLLQDLSLEAGVAIDSQGTLILLDEIQECPKAITALKYFNEQVPESAIATAGSMLGIALDREGGTGYPVGNVEELNLYPLTFREFLDSLGERERILERLLEAGDLTRIRDYAPRYLELLRTYLAVGGMPEVVSTFLETRDFVEVRAAQKRIVNGYEHDLSKHLRGARAEHAMAAWRSIPAHLSEENKDFVFRRVRSSGRGRDYEEGITYLVDAGIATRVCRVNEPRAPLSAYANDAKFKLFLLDVGLLGALAHLDSRLVLEDDAIFYWFRGALTEQFVCQQLIGDLGWQPYYWTPAHGGAENDFLAEDGGDIFAIEVKGGRDKQAKSLKAMHEKFDWVLPIRLSFASLVRPGWIRDVPLYAMGVRTYWGSGRDENGLGDGMAMPPGRESLDERSIAILDALADDPHLSYEDLSEQLDIRRATLARLISTLKARHLLERVGGRRYGSWVVTG